MAAGADHEEKKRAWAVLAAAAVILAALAYLPLTGRVPVQDDLGNQFLPWKLFYARALARGDGLLWCPDVLCGFYLHGEGQVGVLHPANLLLYSLLPAVTAFQVEALLRYPLLALGAYLLLRRRDLPRDAAATGAVLLAFAGFALLRFVHLNAVEVVAHLPWLLLCEDLALRQAEGRRRATALLGVSALTGSQLLLGYPQYVLLSSLAEAMYAASLVLGGEGGATRRALLALAVAKGAGILLGGAQLLPTWTSLSLSVRGDPGLAFKYSYSLHPWNLVQLVSPYFFRRGVYVAPDAIPPAADPSYAHEFAIYDGALAPVLLCWTIARVRSLEPRLRPLAWLALALVAVGADLSLGGYGLLYRIQARLPLVGSFRCPCRSILLAHLGLAIAAAIALADLARGVRAPRLVWAPALLSGLACAGGLALRALAPEQAAALGVGGWERLVGGAAILACASVGVRRAASLGAPTAGLLALALLEAAAPGLWHVDAGAALATRSLWKSAATPPAARVRLGAKSDLGIVDGLRSVDGYMGLPPRRALDIDSPALWRVAAVERAMQLDDAGGRVWIVDPAPLAYARLYASVRPTDDPARDLATTDAATVALVAEDLAPPPGIARIEARTAAPATGTATLGPLRNGRIEVRTEAPGPRLLFVAEAAHPGWRVRVDGREARPPVAVFGDFQGVFLEAGAHEVVFEFAPRDVVVGAWVSALGALIALAQLGIGLRRARPRDVAPASV